MIVNALTTTTGGNWLDVPMAVIVSEIASIIPVVIPVAITIMAVRKGIRFLLGVLRGA